MNMTHYEWVPTKSVGPFEFGTDITEYIDEYGLFYDPELDQQDVIEGSAYHPLGADESITIYVDSDGKIESIHCSQCFFYRGLNLIGIDVATFSSLVGCQPDPDVDTIELPVNMQESKAQDVYEFDDVAAQVWVDDGKIVTIFVYGPYEDS